MVVTATAAHAQSCAASGSPGCSRAFYGAGTCDGQDNIPINQNAWESKPIFITGIDIAAFQVPPGGFQYVFAGNSFTPDVMAFIGNGSTQIQKTFPLGSEMLFASPGHVDLHVACATPGAQYQLEYIVYYRLAK